MEILHNRLDKTINFLSQFLPLVNSHMVEFFSKNLWENHVSENVRSEFTLKHQNNGNIIDISKDESIWNSTEFGIFIETCNEFSLDKNELIVPLEILKKIHRPNNTEKVDQTRVNKFMSEKKIHEVQIMSELVALLFSKSDATHIIDIGDGKGYLSLYLSLQHKIKVLGLDSSKLKTEGAAKRAIKLKKLWNNVDKKRQRNDEESSTNTSLFTDNQNNKSIEYYKQVTKMISFDTDLRQILCEHFPNNSYYQFGLVGLHTCGGLSPICLKQFVDSINHVPFIVNVGCCYHLLDEGSDSSTFPLSNYLKQKNFRLGRNARMLSLQSPSRIFVSKKIDPSLMYRAVFEVFIEQKMKKVIGTEEAKVGRIGSKCSSFVEYVRCGLKKLECDLNISDDEINSFYNLYSSSSKFLEFYFMMRVHLAPVIENIILLDRLLYLKENGIKTSFLVKLFDSYISPRCYGLVAIRDG